MCTLDSFCWTYVLMEYPSITSLVAKYREVEEAKDPIWEKERDAVHAVQRAFREYGIAPLVVSYNGGKDSDVCAHIWRLALYLYLEQQGRAQEYDEMVSECLFIVFHNPLDFEEIDAHLERTTRAIGVRVAESHDSFKEGLVSMISTYGIKAVILGVRDTDPQGIGLDYFAESTPDFPPFMRVFPLIHWTYGDVWRFIFAFSIPYCSLYREG